MQNNELRKLLIETCPVLPGQEDRAWNALKARLNAPRRSAWSWLFLPTWRGALVGSASVVLLALVGGLSWSAGDAHGLATADSKSPGVYATAFYSRSAGAQVVWLNGMAPSTDRPTYLDPTTTVAEPAQKTPAQQQPTGDPNSL